MATSLARLSRAKMLRVAGLMSGTSADGVDVAIIDIVGDRIRPRAFATVPYPAAFRRRIVKLFDVKTARVDEICHMNMAIGEFFASALRFLCRRRGVPFSSIDLIGSHGQTIHHLPDGLGREQAGSTLQIGEPAVIAERTGITTVANFRPRDLAAGGQGAPLVPLADYVLFFHPTRTRAVQNIGGIANVTYLPAGSGLADVRAFDTGPGNMIIDRLAAIVTRGRLTYDRNGALAAKGRVQRRLLADWMRHPYFRRRPPKTSGREMFGVSFANELYRRAHLAGIVDCDILATATALTAASIAMAYRRFLPAAVKEVILCGGGARNQTLVAMLREELATAKVVVMDELGIDADAKEAVSFAILAVRTIRGQAGNVPSATGAKRDVVLGSITPGGGVERGENKKGIRKGTT